jgi:hypothetical protein
MRSCEQRVALLLAGALLLSGCAQTKSWLDRGRADDSRDRSRDEIVLGAPDAEDYLADLEQVAAGDPATQIEIYADAESRSTLTPNPSTNLRFALILATPGHSEYDPERAQSMLREILTQTPLMTRSEISLARIYLAAVEETIVLEAEARRLRQTEMRTAQTQERAISQRLATVEAENRQLRSELTEAENKLEAITSIERTIREQGKESPD